MRRKTILLIGGVAVVILAAAGTVAYRQRNDVPSERRIPTEEVEVPEGYTQTEIAHGIDTPTGLAILPDGTYLVAQQTGGILQVDADGEVTEIGQVETTALDEEGLMSIAVGTGTDGGVVVYVVYTIDGSYQRLSRFRLTDEGLLDDEVALAEFEPNTENFHIGGALAIEPNGSLLVTTGEHVGAAPRDPAVQGGKVFRIPDAASRTTLLSADEILGAQVARGLRNPWGIAASADDRVLLNDIGEITFEEINELADGADYGWPDSEGYDVGEGQTAPVYSYGRELGCAAIGAAFLGDDYLFMDYCSSAINQLRPDGEVVKLGVVAEAGPVALAVTGESIAYLTRGVVLSEGGSGGEMANGALWLLEPE